MKKACAQMEPSTTCMWEGGEGQGSMGSVGKDRLIWNEVTPC